MPAELTKWDQLKSSISQKLVPLYENRKTCPENRRQGWEASIYELEQIQRTMEIFDQYEEADAKGERDGPEEDMPWEEGR